MNNNDRYIASNSTEKGYYNNNTNIDRKNYHDKQNMQNRSDGRRYLPYKDNNSNYKQHENVVRYAEETKMRLDKEQYLNMRKNKQQAFKHFYLPQYRRLQQKQDGNGFRNIKEYPRMNTGVNNHPSDAPGHSPNCEMKHYMRKISAPNKNEYNNQTNQSESKNRYNTNQNDQISGVEYVNSKDEEMAVCGFISLINDIEKIYNNKVNNK